MFLQDEYKFYMEDAGSKLLLVPASGSKHAEAAASGLSIPIASMQLQQQGEYIPGMQQPPAMCFRPGFLLPARVVSPLLER